PCPVARVSAAVHGASLPRGDTRARRRWAHRSSALPLSALAHTPQKSCPGAAAPGCTSGAAPRHEPWSAITWPLLRSPAAPLAEPVGSVAHRQRIALTPCSTAHATQGPTDHASGWEEQSCDLVLRAFVPYCKQCA